MKKKILPTKIAKSINDFIDLISENEEIFRNLKFLDKGKILLNEIKQGFRQICNNYLKISKLNFYYHDKEIVEGITKFAKVLYTERANSLKEIKEYITNKLSYISRLIKSMSSNKFAFGYNTELRQYLMPSDDINGTGPIMNIINEEIRDLPVMVSNRLEQCGYNKWPIYVGNNDVPYKISDLVPLIIGRLGSLRDIGMFEDLEDFDKTTKELHMDIHGIENFAKKYKHERMYKIWADCNEIYKYIRNKVNVVISLRGIMGNIEEIRDIIDRWKGTKEDFLENSGAKTLRDYIKEIGESYNISSIKLPKK